MLFRQLTSSLRMGLRMLRTAVTRPFRAVWFRLRRATNLGRQFSKVVPAVTKGVTKVKLKPETRADYIDAGPVFIAKSLFVVIALVLIAGGLFIYYIGWPFVQSRFLTARLPVSDARVETYTGRVKLYADDGKTALLFHGKLEEGAKTGRGKEYYENGQLQYEGMFAGGLYEGKGTLYDEQNHRLYEGDFLAGVPQGHGIIYENGLPQYEGNLEQGVYQGAGRLFWEDGKTVLYEGSFDQGSYSGTGTLYNADGRKLYEGGFVSGQYEGKGTLFADGAAQFTGTFSGGLLSGAGAEFYPDGTVKYQGDFEQGVYSGAGALFWPDGSLSYKGGFLLGKYDGEGSEYFKDGAILYTGSYVMGQRTGSGKLYDEGGKLLYEGELFDGVYQGAGRLLLSSGDVLECSFEQGVAQGSGTVYRNGKLYLEGSFTNGLLSGGGTLYNTRGKAIYQGNFESAVPCPIELLGQTADNAVEAFAQARSETREESGYGLVINRDAGIALVTDLPAAEDTPAKVYEVYVYNEELLLACGLEQFGTLDEPVSTGSELLALPVFAGGQGLSQMLGGEADAAPASAKAPDQSRWFEYDGYTITAWGWTNPDAAQQAKSAGGASEAKDSSQMQASSETEDSPDPAREQEAREHLPKVPMVFLALRSHEQIPAPAEQPADKEEAADNIRDDQASSKAAEEKQGRLKPPKTKE